MALMPSKKPGDRAIRYLSLLASALIVGCSASQLPLGEVEGTVLLDGQPLANAIVEFQPEGPLGKGRPSVGETGPDGKYKLRFSNNLTGAVAGKHKVMITTFSPTGDGKFKERVPPIYNTSTTLIREVQRDPNWHDFDLRTSNTTGESLADGE